MGRPSQELARASSEIVHDSAAQKSDIAQVERVVDEKGDHMNYDRVDEEVHIPVNTSKLELY